MSTTFCQVQEMVGSVGPGLPVNQVDPMKSLPSIDLIREGESELLTQ